MCWHLSVFGGIAWRQLNGWKCTVVLVSVVLVSIYLNVAQFMCMCVSIFYILYSHRFHCCKCNSEPNRTLSICSNTYFIHFMLTYLCFHKVLLKPYPHTKSIHIAECERIKKKEEERTKRNKNGWTWYYYAHTMTHIRISVAKRDKNQIIHLVK